MRLASAQVTIFDELVVLQHEVPEAPSRTDLILRARIKMIYLGLRCLALLLQEDDLPRSQMSGAAAPGR